VYTTYILYVERGEKKCQHTTLTTLFNLLLAGHLVSDLFLLVDYSVEHTAPIEKRKPHLFHERSVSTVIVGLVLSACFSC
jgi:hypothetical protein